MIGEGGLLAGRYRLLSQVGAGAMGVVWQARDERLHRVVAVKQLLLRAETDPKEAEEAKSRVMREGRLAARLHHPHAIAVYNVDEDAGAPYLIMEYLPSRSLRTILAERGPLPPEEVARIGSQVAAALAAAHEAGIVHRDIKPDNVLVAEDGTAKITDFGISHAVGDTTMTATGFLACTPAYLAPEVARGQKNNFAADVFSLGSTLYAAVEGTPPFGFDENALALVFRVASSEVAPPSSAGPLTEVLAWLLDADPARRPSMEQACEALAAVAAGSASPAVPTVTVPRVVPPPPPIPALGPAFAPPAAAAASVPAASVAAPAPAADGADPAHTTKLVHVGGPSPWSPNEPAPAARRRHWATMVIPAVIALVTVGGILTAALIHNSGSSAGSGSGSVGTTTGPAPSRRSAHLAPAAEATVATTSALAPTSAAPPAPPVALHPGPVTTTEPTPTPTTDPNPTTTPAPSEEPTTSSSPTTTPSPSEAPSTPSGSSPAQGP